MKILGFKLCGPLVLLPPLSGPARVSDWEENCCIWTQDRHVVAIRTEAWSTRWGWPWADLGQRVFGIPSEFVWFCKKSQVRLRTKGGMRSRRKNTQSRFLPSIFQIVMQISVAFLPSSAKGHKNWVTQIVPVQILKNSSWKNNLKQRSGRSFWCFQTYQTVFVSRWSLLTCCRTRRHLLMKTSTEQITRHPRVQMFSSTAVSKFNNQLSVSTVTHNEDTKSGDVHNREKFDHLQSHKKKIVSSAPQRSYSLLSHCPKRTLETVYWFLV